MLGSYRVAEQLMGSRVVLSSTELDGYILNIFINQSDNFVNNNVGGRSGGANRCIFFLEMIF
jgi:hypothetical protein